jgi:hypothetical protein
MRFCFCQRHESRANFVKLVKICGSIQNDGSKSDFLALLLGFSTIFQSSFCIHMVVEGYKFCKNFSNKSKMAAKIASFLIPATILNFFDCIFFYKICVLLTPNECLKKLDKL